MGRGTGSRAGCRQRDFLHNEIILAFVLLYRMTALPGIDLIFPQEVNRTTNETTQPVAQAVGCVVLWSTIY